MKLLSELINFNLKVVSSLYMRKTKSYTRTAIQITTGVYVVRYWLIILDFVDGRL